MKRFCAIAVVLALWGVPAASQSPDAESEDEVICIGGRQWVPSLAESGAIESDPVPASFRSLLEPELPCVRMERNEFRLVAWHLRFGSEQSIKPALEYVERYYLREILPPERYLNELSRAWRNVQASLAKPVRTPEDHSAIQEFEKLQESREQYVALANQMLLAAEEFGSRELLEEADRYVRPAVSGYAFVAELESQRMEGDNLVRFDIYNRFLTDEVETRAAVLRATLSRTERAIAQAEAVLRELEPSHYDDLADYAFTGGDDFCDIGSDFDPSGEIEVACQAMDAPHEQVVNYMLSRATLDFVTSEGNSDGWDRSYASAMRFLAGEGSDGLSQYGSRCCRYNTEEDLLRLQLARAQYHQRLFRDFGRRHQHYARHVKGALEALQAAEQLSAPHHAPGRFLRIAEAWLEARQQWTAWLLERDRRDAEETENAQYAAYLERTLAQLDAIAQGQGISDLPILTAPAL